MLPTSNQPPLVHVTAKTYTIESPDIFSMEQFNIRPVIAKTDTGISNAV